MVFEREIGPEKKWAHVQFHAPTSLDEQVAWFGALRTRSWDDIIGSCWTPISERGLIDSNADLAMVAFPAAAAIGVSRAAALSGSLLSSLGRAGVSAFFTTG